MRSEPYDKGIKHICIDRYVGAQPQQYRVSQQGVHDAASTADGVGTEGETVTPAKKQKL